ncbi:MAG TPA: hypothetical protein VKV17_11020 [Bryobacteraceae bacterium]|nr:hypothetical protein [Bryobacteraceae bacterium]
MAECWLYKNGQLFDPYEHGYDDESLTGNVTANAGSRDTNNNPLLIDVDADGAEYEMDSEHYLEIWSPQGVVYDAYGDSIAEDYFGYSVLPGEDDPSETPPDVWIVPPFIGVFWVSQLVDIGSTATYTETSDCTPYISSISPNSGTPSPTDPTQVYVTISGSCFGTYGPAARILQLPRDRRVDAQILLPEQRTKRRHYNNATPDRVSKPRNDLASRSLFTPPAQGMWPNESCDGGSHIGLMMVPTTMADAFNWQQNATDGVHLFANDKLRRAGKYEDYCMSVYPKLRALTLQESELDGLVFYGPGATLFNAGYGAYWIPNAAGTDWEVNNGPNGNPVGVDYVTVCKWYRSRL